MASGGYGRRKAPISRFVPADDISRFTPSPLTTRSPNRWPTSANYLARETSRSYYDELENDVTANDAYSGDGDEETMTLSRRVLSREASIAEDDDDRYDNLDSRTNRIVVDEGEDSDDSSIYDDKDEDDDNDIADDEDDLSEESVLEDDAGVVKVQKRDTTTTHTIANRYHAAVSKIAINKHSNYESDSSEGSEHVGAGGVADSLTEDENDKEDEDKTSMAPRRLRSQTPPEDGTTSRRSARLKDFEKALDESVASDDHFLEMVRDNQTRLSLDTKEWMDQYSLDDGSISAMAERLMEGDMEHLYADLPQEQREVVEETVSRMRDLSLEEIIDSIAAD